MRTKLKRVLVLTGGLACVLGMGVYKGLSNYCESSNFGKAVITLNDASEVYVIHEQWGLHNDRLSVTRNPDGCIPPDPATDYIDEYGDGQNLIYSITNKGLVIYEDQHQPEHVKVHEPVRPWPEIKVTVQKASYDPYGSSRPIGVNVLTVPVNQKCWINFFRRAGSSFGTVGK